MNMNEKKLEEIRTAQEAVVFYMGTELVHFVGYKKKATAMDLVYMMNYDKQLEAIQFDKVHLLGETTGLEKVKKFLLAPYDVTERSSVKKAEADVFMNLKDAADFVGVSPSTLNRYAQDAKYELPAHKIGNGKRSPVRFSRRELEAWVRKFTASGVIAKEQSK